MPARDIYEQLEKLRQAIHEIRVTNDTLTPLEEAFSSLESVIKRHFEDKSDAVQHLEAEMARLLAPFHERLNRNS